MIQLKPIAVCEYEGDSLDVVQCVYYIPKSNNQGFDSFIYADDEFFHIFQ